MLGAIIGDITGSKYEFNNIRNENIELLSEGSFFTDDTVCTIANMDWLLHAKERTQETATEYLRKWTRKYPNAGYGGRFFRWVFTNNPQPYGSYGNGSAMRISPIAKAAKNPEDLKELSNAFTSITHNHPEGIKGALTVASCIYMALRHYDKSEIATFAISQYPEIKTLSYDELKRTYRFNETCQGSVPQAIYCFLISNSFEDCIKKTIAIGGDCDTTSAMSGAIAEAFYGLPDGLKEKVFNFLNPEMTKIVKEFYSRQFTKDIYLNKDPISQEDMDNGYKWLMENKDKWMKLESYLLMANDNEIPQCVKNYVRFDNISNEFIQQLEAEHRAFNLESRREEAPVYIHKNGKVYKTKNTSTLAREKRK